MTNNSTLIFVGDCHSQHRKLADAYSWCVSNFNNPYFVLLGDIFDPRLNDLEQNYPPFSDSLQTYLIVREILQKGGILIQSNHQDKLRRWLKHSWELKKNPIEPKQGLQHTLDWFVNKLTVEEKQELYNFLTQLPYHLVVRSYDLQHDKNVVFLCSHAYFNTDVDLANPSDKHKDQALYGLLTKDQKRAFWWLDDEPILFYGETAVHVAGHYHVLFKGQNQRIIDSRCGNTDGTLSIHAPQFNLWQEF